MKRRAASWLVLCGVALALYPALAQSPRPAATPPAATDVGLVKRVLRKYRYPPDQQEQAVRIVLEQAEQLSFDWAAALVPT